MKLMKEYYTIYMTHGVYCCGNSVCSDVDIDADLYLALLKLEAMISTEREEEYEELISLFESIELLEVECEDGDDNATLSSIRDADISTIKISAEEKELIRKFYEESIADIQSFEESEALPYAEEDGDEELIEAITNGDFWISLHSEYID